MFFLLLGDPDWAVKDFRAIFLVMFQTPIYFNISKLLKPRRTVVDASRKRSTTDIPSEEAMSPTSKSRYSSATSKFRYLGT